MMSPTWTPRAAAKYLKKHLALISDVPKLRLNSNYHWPEYLSGRPRARLFLSSASGSPSPGLAISRCLASMVDKRGESVAMLIKSLSWFHHDSSHFGSQLHCLAFANSSS